METESLLDHYYSETRIINFGCVPVDSVIERYFTVTNKSDIEVTYRASLMYALKNIERVFRVTVSSAPVKPNETTEIKVVFKPVIPYQSYTDYYYIDDTIRNAYKLTVSGKCYGPHVSLNQKQIVFNICKNLNEHRKESIQIVNRSSMDTTYQWLIPPSGQGYFQVSTGNCGLIRAYETITATIMFNGSPLGIYTAELVCLVLNQEPLFLNLVATVFLPGNFMYNISDHVFEKHFKQKNRSVHLMENNLKCLGYIPSASVYDRYLDFGTGSAKDVTLNISQTVSVTNHEMEEGYIQWMTDPDNVFLIDPIECIIPPCESRLFTIRFRPKKSEEMYGYLICGDFQFKTYSMSAPDVIRIKHTWFRIPCIGNTWGPCTEWPTEWECPIEVVLAPTVPTRTTFVNFMLANKLETPMFFKFVSPEATNFVVMPMCGIVQSRGWQIITVALEPINPADYYETWDLVINKVHKTRVTICGNAEISDVEVISSGYNPETHGMFEFPPTITGCTNYATAYFHNVTRMEIHLRVLNYVDWLGADYGGTLVLPPREIVRYHWWFFPKVPNQVYDTILTCSCVCLIDGRPVGEPTELFLHIIGFSELPDLRVLPKQNNLHDIVVDESKSVTITLFNCSSCYFTSNLYYEITGMGDDYDVDRFDIDSPVNSIKPSQNVPITFTATPGGAGSRQINIKYTVLFRTEFDEVEEIQPITKRICVVWYDGIYPTMKVKRTISTACPVILSNYCVWNTVNINALNKALEDVRPNNPLKVNLYAPDLCVRSGYVELIFVLGCVYQAPVAWNVRREKICNCEMVEVQLSISTYEMRHTCVHRPLVTLLPLSGIVSPDSPGIWNLTFDYALEGLNKLCYVLTMPNDRVLHLYINILATHIARGHLTPLRRPVGKEEYLAVLNCGRVPINNLDPVIRIVWLYNPTDVFTTWRLLKGTTITSTSVIRCLLYFAEVPPLGKLAIPFAFLPSEMKNYKMIFSCSFGYETVKLLVIGEGGLPNCIETRIDMPSYVEKIIRAANRENNVYLSTEHIATPIMPTHSLTREILSVCNDTDHIMRFIWLPERIANIVNIVMTPCWGVIQPHTSEWITMSIYTLQEPATFTTTVACEILDLTERRRYQQNELLRRNKIEKCNQEFIITEDGRFYPGINDSPPYVLDLKRPQPSYLAMSVSISSKGQRDGYPRMLIRHMWEKTPPYDLLSSDFNDHKLSNDKSSTTNHISVVDIIRIIDGILWDAMQSKMFKYQLQYYASERIPTYEYLNKIMETDFKSRLSRRVTSGICDAIVNKAVFHVYGLNAKCNEFSLVEAE